MVRTLSSPAARFDRRLPPRPSTTAGSLLLSWSWVCGSLSPCGTGSTTSLGSQWLQAPLLFVPACEAAGLCPSSRRLVRGPSRRDVVPQLKAPALPLWGHIPRLNRPRTSRRLGRTQPLPPFFQLFTRYSMLADFRKCDNFYCQFVTRTWHLPKVCSESRFVDRQLVCSTGDLQCRVPVQTTGAANGPTMVRFQSFAAAQRR